jgi:hypothetical protein
VVGGGCVVVKKWLGSLCAFHQLCPVHIVCFAVHVPPPTATNFPTTAVKCEQLQCRGSRVGSVGGVRCMVRRRHIEFHFVWETSRLETREVGMWRACACACALEVDAAWLIQSCK